MVEFFLNQKMLALYYPGLLCSIYYIAYLNFLARFPGMRNAARFSRRSFCRESAVWENILSCKATCELNALRLWRGDFSKAQREGRCLAALPSKGSGWMRWEGCRCLPQVPCGQGSWFSSIWEPQGCCWSRQGREKEGNKQCLVLVGGKTQRKTFALLLFA